MRERDEIIERIGNGSLSAVAVVKSILKERGIYEKATKTLHKQKLISVSGKKAGEILIAGEKKIPVRLANCCSPKEGDRIIGFTTRGGHVSVHNINCSMLKGLDSKRLIEARWTSDKSSEVIFAIHAEKDRVGLLRDIVDVFAKHNVNLNRFGYGEKTSFLSADITLSADVKDLNLASHLMDRLEDVDGVGKVSYRH